MSKPEDTMRAKRPTSLSNWGHAKSKISGSITSSSIPQRRQPSTCATVVNPKHCAKDCISASSDNRWPSAVAENEVRIVRPTSPILDSIGSILFDGYSGERDRVSASSDIRWPSVAEKEDRIVRPTSPILDSIGSILFDGYSGERDRVSASADLWQPSVIGDVKNKSFLSTSVLISSVCGECSPTAQQRQFNSNMKIAKERRIATNNDISDDSCEEKESGFTDEFLFTRARSRTLAGLVIEKCNSNCSFGRNCLYKLNVQDMNDICDDFWGHNVPTQSKRDSNISSLFSTYDARVSEINDSLSFKVQHKRGDDLKPENFRICDGAFLYILNLIQDNKTPSNAPSMWKRHFNDLKHPEDRDVRNKSKELKVTKGDGAIRKACTDFIKHLAEFYGDYFATKEGSVTVDGVGEMPNKKKILPHFTYRSVYEEYVAYCDIMDKPDSTVASERTFNRALKHLEDKDVVRLQRCHGSFSPCSVCTNCNVILQNKANKYSKDQRVIVLYVRRLHLLQQARERETLDERRNDARRSKLPNGQPIKAFIFGDAFTQGKGDTMKDGVGYQQHSSEDPVISNRIIAYEVDQTMEKGANIIVDLQRQVIDKLTLVLAEQGYTLPKFHFWQFDNSGENKNKEMFCFASLLTELDLVTEIQIAFLMVGHTHCNIDQIFSVLSRAIDNALFVASPLGMMALIGTSHGEALRPKFNIKVEVIYDWVAFFKPFIKPQKLMYYRVPHRFRIIKRCGRAVVQYMLFSPPSTEPEHSLWLPADPLKVNEHSRLNTSEEINAAFSSAPQINNIDVPTFSAFNNENAILSELDVQPRSADLMNSEERMNTFNTYQQMRKSVLPRLEQDIFNDMNFDMEAMALGEDVLPAGSKRVAALKRMIADGKAAQALDSKRAGYIVFLDMDHAGASSGALMERPPLLPYQFDNVESATTETERAWRNGKFKRYAEAVAAIARACRKARELADNSHVPKVPDKFTNGKIDLNLTHRLAISTEIEKRFYLKQMSESEYDWFCAHTSSELIMNEHKKMKEQICLSRWTVLERPEISPEAIRKRERLANEKSEEQHAGLVIAVQNGFRERELPGPYDQERIKRPRGPVLQQSNKTFDSRCSVINCQSLSVIICSEHICRRFLCHNHGEHDVHGVLHLHPLDQRSTTSVQAATSGRGVSSIGPTKKNTPKEALLARYTELTGQTFIGKTPTVNELKNLISDFKRKKSNEDLMEPGASMIVETEMGGTMPDVMVANGQMDEVDSNAFVSDSDNEYEYPENII